MPRLRPLSTRANAARVLPGLRRTLAITGLDTHGTGSFTAQGQVSLVEDGPAAVVVVGHRRGAAEVAVIAEGLRVRADVEVLGALDHVRAEPDLIALASAGDCALVHLTGYDADGHRAPLEVADMNIRAPAGLTAEAIGVDAITLAATIDDVAGTVTVTVGEHVVDLAVTVGAEEVEVLDLADGPHWTIGSARATGTIEPAEGPEPGTRGLALAYDFTGDSRTRGCYAIAPEPVELPGQPRSVRLWLHGSASGEWPRLQMTDGEGVTINLIGDTVTWHGWRQVTFPVPEGTPYPLTFQQVRLMETRPEAQYAGAVIVGPMSVMLSPDVDLPVARPVQDPVIVTDGTVLTNGTVAQRPLRIAVMSDAQFVAREPDSDIVEATRRTLAEIVAAEPDLLVINGDLVDEGAPQDFALARSVLTEEVGDAVLWIYVPGNHEIMGGPIENFIDEFGPTHQAITLAGTRIITLDTSTGTLAGGGLDQWEMLRGELHAAADDPQITGVIVFAHHPTQDPLPARASQLIDRHEAAALEQALADFRAGSGRSVALVSAHAGVFHGRSSEGVSHLINGNSGKDPAGTPATGGFTGWTMLGVNPAAGRVGALPEVPGPRLDWLQAQVNPRVDDLILTGSQTLHVGEQAEIEAYVLQDEGRRVPLGWPLSARWGGLRTSVGTGRPSEVAEPAVAAPPNHQPVVHLDLATRILTAIAPGRAVLEACVNQESARLPVTVVDRRRR